MWAGPQCAAAPGSVKPTTNRSIKYFRVCACAPGEAATGPNGRRPAVLFQTTLHVAFWPPPSCSVLPKVIRRAGLLPISLLEVTEVLRAPCGHHFRSIRCSVTGNLFSHALTFKNETSSGSPCWPARGSTFRTITGSCPVPDLIKCKGKTWGPNLDPNDTRGL